MEERFPPVTLHAGHDIQLVAFGQQPRPSLPARERADLAVQWPALGLALRGIREHGVC